MILKFQCWYLYHISNVGTLLKDTNKKPVKFQQNPNVPPMLVSLIFSCVASVSYNEHYNNTTSNFRQLLQVPIHLKTQLNLKQTLKTSLPMVPFKCTAFDL